MSLQYVIDGYNLINHPGICRRHKHSASPRQSLLKFIRQAGLTGSARNKVIVVFDGYPPADEAVESCAENCGILAIFSRKISADEKIKKIVEESAGRKSIIVVSDDRGIGFMVKSLGAGSIGVEEFLAPAEKSASLSRKTFDSEELSYTQKQQIDKELKKKWLGGG